MAMNYTPIPDDFLEEMEELSDAEYGRFIRSLQTYRMTGEMPELRGNERFYAKRGKMQIDRYVEHYEATAQQHREAGAKGGRPRKNQMEPNGFCENQMEPNGFCENQTKPNESKKTYTKTNTETNTETDNTPLKPPQGGKRGGRDADFDRFWAAYPRKVGKEAARKAFAKTDAPIDTLLAAIEAQRASPQWRRDDGQYIPHPATWLNQGRWEDEVAIPSAPQQPARRTQTTSSLSDLERMKKLREKIQRG